MFDVYLVDTVVLKIIMINSWSEPTVASTVTLRARIDYSQRMVFDGRGEKAVSGAMIWLKYRTISLRDKINFDGRDHAIINIFKDKDFTVNKILKVAVS